MNQQAAAAATLGRWRADPVAFVRECIGVEPDAWQVDALHGLLVSRRIALQACKGPGKTACLAWIMLWFLVTRSRPKCAATSISGDNLQDGLWTELARWIGGSPILQAALEWRKTRVVRRDCPDVGWASARSWSRSASTEQQADTLAGLHADEMLFVADEVGSMPDAVIAAAEAGLANVDEAAGRVAWLVIAGNPTRLDGPLYRAATRERSLWHRVEITGDPDSPKRSPRVSVEWAREQISKYGADSPWVAVNVYGRFPASAINSLLSVAEVEEAMARHCTDANIAGLPQVWGVDVAREGLDASVLVRRQGVGMWMPYVWRGIDSITGAAELARLHKLHHPAAVFVDATGGFGASWIDQLKQLGHRTIPVGFAQAASQPQLFLNRRAEMWWRMAEWVRGGGCLPDCPELVGELTVPEYSHVGDRMQLEPKDQIRERLGRSPDIADALALTFAAHVATPAAQVPIDWMAHTGQSARSHRNPFDVRNR